MLNSLEAMLMTKAKFSFHVMPEKVSWRAGGNTFSDACEDGRWKLGLTDVKRIPERKNSV